MKALPDAPVVPPGERRARGRPTRAAMVDTGQLLKHARQVFARRGFDATSVRDIARCVGVDPALIAHYFGSKEELWAAVVEQIAGEAVPIIDATARLRDSAYGPGERLERAIVIFIERVFREPDIGLFFSTAATEYGERLTFLVDRLVRPYRDAMIPLIVDAIAAGEVEKNDPEVVYWMLINAISKTVSYSHVMDAFSNLPTRPAAFKRAVLKTALSMIGRPCVKAG